MPLPASGPLSVHVQSGLANAVQSKPKQAMIIRMSAETLEALESFPNHPPLQFRFGDNPGIHIGETFYSMRSQRESSPHEIYLRAASAAKPNAPLKLYANVIGKFMVERQLGAKVTDGVRQRTIEAKKAHAERQAILLDQPPIPTPGTKSSKRKTPGSGTVIKKGAPSSSQLRAPSSTVPVRKLSPLPQNPPSSKVNANIRRRLVHCLAIQPRLTDDAIRMVGGANISAAAREDLLRLLEEVAEQAAPIKKGDKSPRPWGLKSQTWTEVRPYEWPKLTETERTSMARQARLAFKTLKIPETDPAWDNVRYRSAAPTMGAPVPAPPAIASSNSRSSGATTPSVSVLPPEPKRVVVTKDTSKQKTKSDASRAKGEISMKDESAKASVARVAVLRRGDVERSGTPSSDSSAAKPPPIRRLPGSGYQAKKTSPGASFAPDGVAGKSAPSTDPRQTPRSSLPAILPPKPASPLPQPHAAQGRKSLPAVQPKPAKKPEESHKEKEHDLDRKQKQWEREKKIEAKLQRERDREREHEREREREKVVMEKAAPTAGFKRKSVTQEPNGTQDEDSSTRVAPIPKKRKVDGALPPTTASSSSKHRDPQLPKKHVQEPAPPPPRQKIKKEPSLSPSHLPLSSQERYSPTPPPTAKENRLKTNGSSTKARRKSPIYTSSEDEGEISQPPPPSTQPRQRRASPPPPPSGMDVSSNGRERDPRHRPRAPYPLPTDHAGLRARYKSSYRDYLDAFSKLVAQRQKIEALLEGESESELDLMDLDDLTQLSTQYKTLKEELETIQEIYRKGKSLSPSD